MLSHPPHCQHSVFPGQLVEELQAAMQISQSGCVAVKLRSWTLNFLSLRLLRFGIKTKSPAFQSL